MNDTPQADDATEIQASVAVEPLGGRERPLFVDNGDGNTLERAIRGHLAALREVERMSAPHAAATSSALHQASEVRAPGFDFR